MLPLSAVLCLFVFPASLSLITEDDEYHRDVVNFVNNNSNLWKAELNRFVDPIDTLTSFLNRTQLEMIKKMIPKFGRNGYLGDTLSHLKNLFELNISIPDSYDPRKTWYQCWSVHQIYDQAGCGSCWAITAASIMSDRICIASKGKIQVEISAEDLIECCDRCGRGCQGLYSPLSVFTYWKDVGVVTGGAYGTYSGCKPYSFPPNCGSPCSVEAYQKSKTPECSRNCSQLYGKPYGNDRFKGKNAYWMRAPYDYSRNETNPLFRKYLDKFNLTLKQLKVRMVKTDLMLNGPLFACFNIHEDFLHYKSGIYYTKHGNMRETYGHCVKLLGWGEENGQAYWIYANTWGRRWGEYGFYRVHIDDLPREIAGGLPDIASL